MPLRVTSAAAALVAFLFAAAALAQSPHRDVYLYQAADRDARLLAGARKEGQALVYTSLNLKDSLPIKEAFEKKYGVKLELWRASSEKVLQRALTEARAGRFAVDAFELDAPQLEALYREGLLEEFYSPQFRNLPPAAFPPHRNYAADRFNFFTIAYNTNLVKPAGVPNSYQDLLATRWAGRLGLEASDTDWFGAMMKSMGEERGLAIDVHDVRRVLEAEVPVVAAAAVVADDLQRVGGRAAVPCVESGRVAAIAVGPSPPRRCPCPDAGGDDVFATGADVRARRIFGTIG